MPVLAFALVGGLIGLILFRVFNISTRQIVLGATAVIGAGLGIYILRALLPVLGPIGAITGATVGAIVLLWLYRMSTRGDD